MMIHNAVLSRFHYEISGSELFSILYKWGLQKGQFEQQFRKSELDSVGFFPCPGECPKGIHPDDLFSTCAKKIIQGLEIRIVVVK